MTHDYQKSLSGEFESARYSDIAGAHFKVERTLGSYLIGSRRCYETLSHSKYIKTPRNWQGYRKPVLVRFAKGVADKLHQLFQTR